MASSSGTTATPFFGAPVAPPQQTPPQAAEADQRPDVTPAPPAPTTAFDVRSLATSACKGIAAHPAYAALLLAALMYLGIRYRAHLPPTHGRMVVAATFGAVLYGLAVLSSGDPMVATKGLAGLMGTADGTASLSLPARIKAAWFVVYPAIAIGAASVPSLRPWPLVAVVSAAIVLPGVVTAKAAS